MERYDDYEKRSVRLKNLSEKELEKRFWELADSITEPLINLAFKHTTPSIERSVLLRMGFSSMEAAAIVKTASDKMMLGKGAGHIVYAVSAETGKSIYDAGISLSEGRDWDTAEKYFKRGR